MSDKQEPEQAEYGIAGLPKRWGVVVQLVGTFGLAVFLVLYYVLVMYPAETERYAKLERSVTNLMEVVEKRQTLVEGEQADRLEELFVAAVTSDFCIEIVAGGEAGKSLSDIRQSLDDILFSNVDLLRGLTRRDGRQVSEMLANKIRVSDMPAETYRMAAEWRELAAIDMLRNCRLYVYRDLDRLRRVK